MITKNISNEKSKKNLFAALLCFLLLIFSTSYGYSAKFPKNDNAASTYEQSKESMTTFGHSKGLDDSFSHAPGNPGGPPIGGLEKPSAPIDNGMWIMLCCASGYLVYLYRTRRRANSQRRLLRHGYNKIIQ